MGFLNRMFKKQESTDSQTEYGKNFVDCVDLVNAWKIKATVDPDVITPDDPVLKSAFKNVVSCPYCSNDIVFGDAVVNTGIAMRIRCPVCHTEPSLQHIF